MFPFLIGTVRTHIFLEIMRYVSKVSIPHRYGKNSQNSFFDDIEKLLFPFLIGTVRTLHNQSARGQRAKFPFLIGTVRTKREYHPR